MSICYLAASTSVRLAASSFGISYLFAPRSFRLSLIDGGYDMLQFTAIGMLLALRR